MSKFHNDLAAMRDQWLIRTSEVPDEWRLYIQDMVDWQHGEPFADDEEARLNLCMSAMVRFAQTKRTANRITRVLEPVKRLNDNGYTDQIKEVLRPVAMVFGLPIDELTEGFYEVCELDPMKARQIRWHK